MLCGLERVMRPLDCVSKVLRNGASGSLPRFSTTCISLSGQSWAQSHSCTSKVVLTKQVVLSCAYALHVRFNEPTGATRCLMLFMSPARVW